MRHVISVHDLPAEEIVDVLDRAEDMLATARGEATLDLLKGKVLACIFFEPSTRTRLSFETAMNRLGGGVIGFAGPEATSVVKGETLADTIRMVSGYADAVVLRHPREGAAKLATEFSDVPIINAGDGAGQHPTQTLLDLFQCSCDTDHPWPPCDDVVFVQSTSSPEASLRASARNYAA